MRSIKSNWARVCTTQAQAKQYKAGGGCDRWLVPALV